MAKGLPAAHPELINHHKSTVLGSTLVVWMKPTNRFLHRGGIPEERDPVAVLDGFVGIGDVGVLAATDLGDKTAARDLVGELADRFAGDMFGGHLDFDDVEIGRAHV